MSTLSQSGNQAVSPVAHLQRLETLLRLEYEHEREEYRRQAEAAGIARRVARGLCWYPLSIGRSYYNSLNQLAVEVERVDNQEVEHAFEYGRPIAFFTEGAKGEANYFNFAATVSYVEGDRMVAVLPSAEALQLLRDTDRQSGVQLTLDETTYHLMFEALTRVIRAKGDRLAHLRDVCHGSLRAETFHFAPLRFPWLNAAQEKAVNRVLAARDVAVVHGPPGTGKTTTLVEAVCETLRRENQVMVCAQSNMAVDWISEQLADRGVTVLRIGNPTRVTDRMLSFTYERRFEAHPDYPQLWALRKAIREIRSRSHRGNEGEALRRKLNSLRDRVTELEVRITEALFGEARVVACTLAGAASRVLMGRHFGTLFIDEAAQALEPACWIAIPKADRFILAGDHCQLPPTVKCVEAARGGLDHTLMEEIVRFRPETVTLLNMQYRMNEAIMRFSSDWFYGGRLEAAPSVRHRGILDLDTPIEWIDTGEEENQEQTMGEDGSRFNRPEAERTLDNLAAYIGKIGRERFLEERIDVGIISPYKAQVRCLRGLLRADARFKPYRGRISVNTVDGFQGQERDIILISLVRANDEGRIGFLADLRRMNVAMTRARMKLLILGDVNTLTHHSFYRKLHAYVRSLQELPD